MDFGQVSDGIMGVVGPDSRLVVRASFEVALQVLETRFQAAEERVKLCGVQVATFGGLVA